MINEQFNKTYIFNDRNLYIYLPPEIYSLHDVMTSKAMKHIGGKMLVFGACIPSVGELALKSTRDNPRRSGKT